ncbi:unnamed protein product, partial [Phaeothamnion confervicola]
MTRIVESRALDPHFDPVYVTPGRDNSAFNPMRPELRIRADGGNPTKGPNQLKFLKRPLIPLLNALPPEILLAPTAHDDPARPRDPEPEPFQRDATTQTRFRESEAQTDPYEPPLAPEVPGAEPPEVLMLRGLVAGHGLPGGAREVAMIEAARQKRALAAALPPFTDEASLHLRKQLMQAQELRELRMRERELDDAREERLRLLRRALSERDLGDEFLAEQRIEALRQARAQHKENRLAHIQRQRLKVLRKLTKARRAMPIPGNDSSRRDIVAEYADFGSEVYAPTKREGRRIDKDGVHFDSAGKMAPLTSYGALAQLEAALPPGMLRSTVAKPPRLGTLTGAAGGNRKAMVTSLHLARMSEILRARADAMEVSNSLQAAPAAATAGTSAAAAAGAAGGAAGLAPPGWKSRGVRRERPATPDSALPIASAEEEQHQALLLLQRLLRGRAAQNVMFEAKERRRELIRELRLAARAEGDPAMSEVSLRVAAEARRTAVHEAALDAMAGEVFSAVLATMAGVPLLLTVDDGDAGGGVGSALATAAAAPGISRAGNGG